MVFDIRGRRRYAVKVVYAVLAVLMGASLFLVVGPLNIGELFNSNSSAGEAAKPFEEQAERLEAKLRKEPESEQLLLSLARAQVSAGNSTLSVEPSEDDLLKALQQYQQGSATWSEYLKVTDEPNAGTAQLMVTPLVFLTERSRTAPEFHANLDAAIEAEQIVAEQRPSLNSLSVLARYQYYNGEFAAAEKAQAEAKKKTHAKFEAEELDKQLKEVKEQAKKVQAELKQVEASEKSAAKANKGNPESLGNPKNPFGGALGGGGLTE